MLRKAILLSSSTLFISNHYNFNEEKENENKKKIKNISPIECEDGSVIMPWEAPTREEQVVSLTNQKYDILVIGGGATGAGCALDAASRGLKVALVERSDFAAGTSSRSTKLIHGGIRYLEAAFTRLDIGSYKLVQEALEERAHMLSSAPYMNRPLPIMIPIYKLWEVPYMWLGAKVYDMVAGNKRFVPPSYYISPEEALYQYPMLRKEGLKGAVVYFDGQMNDSRMNLAIVLTAIQSSATVLNYTEVVKLIKNDQNKLFGAILKDTLTGKEMTVHAKTIINATGPFSDSIRKMDDPTTENIVVPAAGVHVVLPDHFSPERMGLIVPKTSDGRVLFFLPWENATLAGTTDSVSDITIFPEPSKKEIDFIIDEANRYLAKTVTRNDVRSAWSGIRPLVKDPRYLGTTNGKSETSKISREHIIEVSDSGLITIAGGKWTTYRRMAEDAIDSALKNDKELNNKAKKCTTKDMQLIGADRIGEVCKQKFENISVILREKYNFDKDVAIHLMRNYGTRALQIAEIVRNGYLDRPSNAHPRRLHPKYPFMEAEIIFSVKQEYAVKAVDFISRRIRLAYIDSEATRTITPRVIQIMGDLLNWSNKRRQEELKECEKLLNTMNN